MMKIDNKFTYLPLSMTKGTTQQRFQKAAALNLKFFNRLKYDFENREINSTTFKNTLWNTLGKKLTINVIGSKEAKDITLMHNLNEKGKCKGYTLIFPKDPQSNKNSIKQSLAPKFLRETQKFFNDLLNPKHFARYINILNKNQPIMDAAIFYKTNIANGQKLTQKSLNDFLRGRTTSEKINFLQLLRYNTQSELALEKASPHIDREVAKFEHIKFTPTKPETTQSHTAENIEVLNERLKTVLDCARKK